MKAAIINKSGSKVGEAELADAVFAVKKKTGLIWEAVINEQANRHLGTAFKKNKRMVSGSTKKPYRQKGTGNARQGNERNPHYRGGGRAFGGKWANFKYELPKKEKAVALKAILSEKAAAGKIKVIDSLTVDAPKTKQFAELLSKIAVDGAITVIVAKADRNLKLAARNIEYAHLIDAAQLNANDLFYCDEIIMTNDALDAINKQA